MDLLLQQGHGMKEHIRVLLEAWSGGGAILSPRDSEEDKLCDLGDTIREAGGEVFLDPQCFVHRADHLRLIGHRYFKLYRSAETSSLGLHTVMAPVVAAFADLSRSVGARKHILPGILDSGDSNLWFDIEENTVEVAKTEFGDEPMIATIALGPDAMRDEARIERVVEESSLWDVDGYYVVAQSRDNYLIADPVWLGNLLILASGLALTKRTVIVGYCSHQMLCLASANVDYVASGTARNVRVFLPDRYDQPGEGRGRQIPWYYCPQTLSEFKIASLDEAFGHGLLDLMPSSSPQDSQFADTLFGGALPSNVRWKTPDAARHYLTSLRGQVREARLDSYDATIAAHRNLLNGAESLLASLRAGGVFAGDRDFTRASLANREALERLDEARKARLRREW